MQSLRPALFLDRDGIINVDTNFLYRIEDVVFVDGIDTLIRKARERGYAIIVVTNQSGIGRGYYTEEDFHTLMQWMEKQVCAPDPAFDGVYYCPFHPVHGQGKYRTESELRKPRPGMLLQAAKDHHLDLSRSLMIGDRCTDMGAAAQAGVPTRLLLRGMEHNGCPPEPSYVAIDSLHQALAYLS